jgi:acetylornithine deacetylase/succinyl-diaminopimelate desuccinylase-like protein
LATANINCRLLPEDSTDYVLSTLQKVVNDNQVTIIKTEGMKPGPSSPLRPDVMHAVTAATNSIWPNIPVVAIMVTGATDGRYLRAAGIPTYGVQGLFSERDDIRAHGRDERLKMQSFYEGQAFLYDLVKRLSTA